MSSGPTKALSAASPKGGLEGDFLSFYGYSNASSILGTSFGGSSSYSLMFPSWGSTDDLSVSSAFVIAPFVGFLACLFSYPKRRCASVNDVRSHSLLCLFVEASLSVARHCCFLLLRQRVNGSIPCLLRFVPRFGIVYLERVVRFNRLRALSTRDVLSQAGRVGTRVFRRDGTRYFQVASGNRSFPLIPRLRVDFLRRVFDVNDVLRRPVDCTMRFTVV